jgi:transposase
MSKQGQKSYSVEFKEQAVHQALTSDVPIAQTARNLGVNENTLHTWIGKYGPHRSKSSESDREPMYEELKRLRQENHRLRQERDILKKAAAYFAAHSR